MLGAQSRQSRDRRTIVDREADSKPDKGAKKPWVTPSVRSIELTEEERKQLKASDDAMALLLKMNPELKPGG